MKNVASKSNLDLSNIKIEVSWYLQVQTIINKSKKEWVLIDYYPFVQDNDELDLESFGTKKKRKKKINADMDNLDDDNKENGMYYIASFQQNFRKKTFIDFSLKTLVR